MKQKYTIDDFRGTNIKQRQLLVWIAIANEMHSLYSLQWEKSKKRYK